MGKSVEVSDRRGWRPFSLAQKKAYAKSKREEELKTVLFNTNKVAKMARGYEETIREQRKAIGLL
jgi:hypothetical protein